jgi:hypothetical protein
VICGPRSAIWPTAKFPVFSLIDHLSTTPRYSSVLSAGALWDMSETSRDTLVAVEEEDSEKQHG